MNRPRSRLRRAARNAVRTLRAAGDVLRSHGASRLRFLNGRLVADVRQTPGGPLFVELLDLGVGRPLYIGGTYEQEESAFIERTLAPGMTVVDVGANIGFVSTLAARRIGPSGRVIAIEPDPRNAQLLSANLERNGCSQVTICRCAAGAAPGTATLYQSDWNMGHHRINAGADEADAEITVPIEVVDNLVDRFGLTTVDFVKMDVEGYEPGVLAGLTRTLTRDRPIVLTEFWPVGMRSAGFSPEDFISEFLRLGYAGRTVDHAGLPLRSVSELMRTCDADSPASYTNLVFTPSEKPHA